MQYLVTLIILDYSLLRSLVVGTSTHSHILPEGLKFILLALSLGSKGRSVASTSAKSSNSSLLASVENSLVHHIEIKKIC